MSVTDITLSPPSLMVFLFTISVLATPSTSSEQSFVFAGCSQLKYTPNSHYESSINSLLTSIVNSATFTSYNNFTIVGPTSQETVYGLFQCRGDLDNDGCARCVAYSVSQLGTLCPDSCGGALQLDGCFVKYDNTSFFGVEDKTEVVKKCGPSIAYDSDALTRRDAALAYLSTGDGPYKPFRIYGYGDVRGVAQCVGDLSPSKCQDCVSEAIGRLKTECGAAAWGDVYLAKCHVMYWEQEHEHRSHGGNGGFATTDDTKNNDDEIEKTLAITIGLIAGVGLIIVFLSFLNKMCEKRKGSK